MNSIEYDHELNAAGLFCPEPVMMLHAKIDDIGEGEVLKVIATDPSTKRDIVKFCSFLGHQLLAKEEEGGQFFYWIKKN